MNEEFFVAAGEIVRAEELEIPKARQLARYLLGELNPWARLVEIRRGDTISPRTESVIFEVDVELSQVTKSDIRPIERICVTFTDADDRWPEVLALRTDFPLVPHRNLRPESSPRSLCLYEVLYADERLRWTAVRVVERVRSWLSQTASGALHREDQPLEPLFIGTRDIIILPLDIYRSLCQGPEVLSVFRYDREPWGQVFIANRETSGAQPQDPNSIAITYVCPPIEHGIIRYLPESLLDLHKVMLAAAGELLETLSKQMGSWQCDNRLLQRHLILIVIFQKLRGVDRPVETFESWVFVTQQNVGLVGEALNLWQLKNNAVGRLIGTTVEEARADEIKIVPLNPAFALSRELAANLNGGTVDMRRITAIGMGALGSQVTCLLARAGYGMWTLVDGDIMLPHNFARHVLPYQFVGHAKAEAMKIYLDALLAEVTSQQYIFADVLNPGNEQAKLHAAMESSDAIIDFSASISLARHLALGVPSSARRVSAFLNPSGSSLIVLSEDIHRRVRLDALEMQYYRAALSRVELEDHFKAANLVRYARSCGDASNTLPGQRVALHAAIAAKAIRSALAKDGAGIDVWTALEDDSVQAIHITPSEIIEAKVSGWEIITDKDFVDKLSGIRTKHLPNETGGVLLGTWDLLRRLIYIVDAIPAPLDSKERTTSFIRGCKGLNREVEAAVAKTGGMLQYVGEWHSHPDGVGTTPSNDDCFVFGWINELTSKDGYPPVMLIVGANGFRWFAEQTPNGKPLAD